MCIRDSPAAVAKDAVLYAKSHKVDCVLVDTAGRMQTSSNLMEQIAKITKVVKPDMKIFVGDSLAGNDTVNQAREFHKQVNFECSILTKSDADARGGAALSIVKVTSSPIIYVGVGQEYDDIVKFSKQTFLENVFESTDIDVPSLSEIKKSKPEPQPEPQESDDPFEGIETNDINNYADLYDVSPPETENDAKKLANQIKKWIQDGRPKP